MVLSVINRQAQLYQLQVKLRKSKRASFSPGSRKNLVLKWRTFSSFCFYFNRPSLPTSADTFCLYAQFLAITFKAKVSFVNYISGAKTLHALKDMPVTSFLD